MKSPEEYHQLIQKISDKHDALENPETVEEAERFIIHLQALAQQSIAIETKLKALIQKFEDYFAQAVKQEETVLDKMSSFLGGSTRKVPKNLTDKQKQMLHQRKLYRAELLFANSVTAVIQQVTIPQHQAFITSQQKPVKINYFAYIRSPEWKAKAEEAKARANNRCQVCNKSRAEVQLDAHHRTYENLGNEKQEDITVLCRDCHELYEKNKNGLVKPCQSCGELKIPANSNYLYCKNCYQEQQGKKPPKNVESLTKGFCIRCNQGIKLDPKVPYCRSCYKVWKKYNNLTFEEKVCHICGTEHTSSMSKPVCYSCYKKHRKTLTFN